MKVKQRIVKYEVYSNNCFFKTLENTFEDSIDLEEYHHLVQKYLIDNLGFEFNLPISNNGIRIALTILNHDGSIDCVEMGLKSPHVGDKIIANKLFFIFELQKKIHDLKKANLNDNKEKNLFMAVIISDINTNSGINSREIGDYIRNFDKEGKDVAEMIKGVIELI